MNPLPHSKPPRSPPSPSSLTRLSDELIIDIFRNRVLSRDDLYRCSLISRRFLSPVNEILYSHIEVTINRLWDESDDSLDAEENAVWEWSNRAWKLLRTLMDHPELASSIQSIHFEKEYEHAGLGEGQLGSGIKGSSNSTLFTTPLLAFKTMVRIARRKLTRISFDEGWIRISKELEIIAELDTIAAISTDLNDLTLEEYDHLVEFFPRLKHLRCGYLTLDDVKRSHLTRLEVFEIAYFDGRPESRLEFLLANASTLRKLRVNLDAALELDYSLFPRLVELDLRYPTYPRGPVEDFDELKTKCQKFWEFLSKSPSLETLCLSSNYSTDYNRCLFRSPPIRSPTLKSIPTLKTFRFHDDINLDVTNTLLSNRLGENIRTVVLPDIFGGSSLTLEIRNKIHFVATAGREREVVFAEAEGRLAWDVARYW
ncbi:uncharacterized protein JCM6883_001319 [Sporobolomyces salmoneus]|uniref:uncharacterized protein n=1 Tax=Sporobolomyces salmoneus TaxID=183962 RepID=UPI00317294A6